jgi:lactoylglutathione lyase
MARADFPAPEQDFLLTHFLVVSDMDRSREFYTRLLGGTVVFERSPVMIKVANSWLILNEGGGPTDDKPDVILETPPDPHRTSAFLNIRVADIAAIYDDWRKKGAEFLTEPKDHGGEIRAYVGDPMGISSRSASPRASSNSRNAAGRCQWRDPCYRGLRCIGHVGGELPASITPQASPPPAGVKTSIRRGREGRESRRSTYRFGWCG